MARQINMTKRATYVGCVFDELLGLGWAIQEAVDFCNKLKHADVVERKRGRWENIVYDPVLRKMEATCSYCVCRGEVRAKGNCCGFVVPDSDFCPNCGARMEVDHEAD